MTAGPARRVEVTVVATGHRFIATATLDAVAAVYRDGYELCEVVGADTRHGFTYLRLPVTCGNGEVT